MWVVVDVNTVSNAHPLTFLPHMLPSNSHEPEISLFSPKTHHDGASVGHLMLTFASSPWWRTRRAPQWRDTITSDGYSCLFVDSRVRDSAWVGTTSMLALFCVCERPPSASCTVLAILSFWITPFQVSSGGGLTGRGGTTGFLQDPSTNNNVGIRWCRQVTDIPVEREHRISPRFVDGWVSF